MDSSRTTRSDHGALRCMLPIATCMAVALLATPRAAARPQGGVPQPADALDGVAQPVLPAAGVPQPADVIMLQLRDGGVRWGAILQHDAESVRFQSLENGGTVRVPWAILDPGQEAALRERFGYVDVTSEEILISADRIVLHSGKEIIGVRVSSVGDNHLVKVDGNVIPIKKSTVASISANVTVPALDVFSREEIYAQHATSLVPEDAASQLALAELCERILDFQHAAEHYAAAKELRPGDEAVTFALARATEKAEQQAQIDYLREADLMRKRGRFDEGLARLVAFSELYPGSPLTTDALKSRERLLKARDSAIRDEVQRKWPARARQIASSAARDLTLDAAREFATAQLSELVLVRVTEDIRDSISEGIQPEDVRRYWNERGKRPYMAASYGAATWLLGEEAARKGLEPEKEADEPALDARSAERKEFEAKLARLLDNSRRQRQATGNRDQEELASKHWAGMNGSERGGWIFALYVEASGDFELYRSQLRSCSTCAGTGVTEVIYLGGANSDGDLNLARCAQCQGVGGVRRIYFR